MRKYGRRGMIVASPSVSPAGHRTRLTSRSGLHTFFFATDEARDAPCWQCARATRERIDMLGHHRARAATISPWCQGRVQKAEARLADAAAHVVTRVSASSRSRPSDIVNRPVAGATAALHDYLERFGAGRFKHANDRAAQVGKVRWCARLYVLHGDFCMLGL